METEITYILNKVGNEINLRTTFFNIKEALNLYIDHEIIGVSHFFAINNKTYQQFFIEDIINIKKVDELIMFLDKLYELEATIVDFCIDLDNRISIFSHDEEYVEFIHFGETEFDVIKNKYNLNDELFEVLKKNIGKIIWTNLSGEIIEIIDD